VSEILAALQESAYAASARDSVFLYPIANVTHVLAVLVFFAAVAAMDFRLLGVFGGTPAREVVARLRPVALVALVLIAATGFTLFSTEAVATGRNPAFQLKLAAIALGLTNVGVNDWLLRREGEGSALARLSAGLSLVLWLTVAACGRSIAYV
jgi:hypothetical protein